MRKVVLSRDSNTATDVQIVVIWFISFSRASKRTHRTLHLMFVLFLGNHWITIHLMPGSINSTLPVFFLALIFHRSAE